MKNKIEQLAKHLHRLRKTVLLITVVVLITTFFDILAFVVFFGGRTIRSKNVSSIYATGVEAYGGDLFSANGTMTLDWGVLYLGSSKQSWFYLRSVSTVPIILDIETTNWMPKRLQAYMLLSCNYTGTQIAPNEEILVQFTLFIPPAIDLVEYLIENNVTSFSFDIYISPLR